jgi:hypothetical protein
MKKLHSSSNTAEQQAHESLQRVKQAVLAALDDVNYDYTRAAYCSTTAAISYRGILSDRLAMNTSINGCNNSSVNTSYHYDDVATCTNNLRAAASHLYE